ncbi:MAG: hypothetical protein DMF78_17480 [Acidobacteria bacterium]|nr:MAG: hypothetical protein DMF78_17480 [Acidobacteriota bacterium]
MLAVVRINAESRVSVARGPAPAELVEGGTRIFLVKVLNLAGVTAPLVVESPNSGRVYTPSWESTSTAEPVQTVTARDVGERWADISLYRTDVSVYSAASLGGRLTGLPVEYQLLQVYSRDRGQRSALLRFGVGQGSQDLGFRGEATILFDARPAYPVTLHVADEDGRPATASLLIKDGRQRVYPSQSKRLAPDLWFQPQVYRAEGDTVLLPAGAYTVTCGRGPEYLPQVQELVVSGPGELRCRPERWIDPSRRGWYSGDHHIHAAGCAHYESPEQGVTPRDMAAQVQGEALNVGAVLTWGPCYYYQKGFFSGHDDPLSTARHLLHYDLEVSGFPSSHAGHLVLLGLTEQDYPGTRRIEDWPTWDLPVLLWAKAQKSVTGFAHSGWGLAVSTPELPNHAMPGFDSIGANEYIVDVTHEGAVDFISTADTPPPWELNIWYHTLNVGFRTRISGETDFPCISGERVGQGRVYAKVDGRLTYGAWTEAIRTGRAYVGDGRSHLMDFTVNGREVGTGGSEVRLAGGAPARVTVKVAALLDAMPNEALRRLRFDQAPYWDLERARIGSSREVPVELVVNSRVAARQTVTADGTLRDVSFEVPLAESSWLAVRILPSSHTNPVFAIVDGKPIRASRRSAEWCLAAVGQCWTQKAPKIAAGELEAARQAYDHARAVYRALMAESDPDR